MKNRIIKHLKKKKKIATSNNFKHYGTEQDKTDTIEFINLRKKLDKTKNRFDNLMMAVLVLIIMTIKIIILIIRT